ncbi:hypothetical protein BpHYR1_017908 [Brachionus plicatilis]|uniref:Uncharacterized protein n=1 Tax=Brachionus plicatilis TaxID=10195 RepID=A0A3M7SX99_BRAPC|nr:hypothetical protein BpHYR1_017908 [Brachionus plicatilis]
MDFIIKCVLVETFGSLEDKKKLRMTIRDKKVNSIKQSENLSDYESDIGSQSDSSDCQIKISDKLIEIPDIIETTIFANFGLFFMHNENEESWAKNNLFCLSN